MTCGAIIALVDKLKPNRFTAEQKYQWLSDLDGMIVRELIETHEGSPLTAPFAGYSPEKDEDTELLVPAPYDGLYRWYFLDGDTGTISEKTYDIWRLIRCDENEPRVVTATEEHFAQARKKAEDYIKKSYMRSVQAPLGVKPRLVTWLELC